MICKKCGVEVSGNYCSNCGEKLDLVESNDKTLETTKLQNQINEENEKKILLDDLEEEICSQPVRVVLTNFLIRNENRNSFDADLLQTVIQNDSGSDIEDIFISLHNFSNNENCADYSYPNAIVLSYKTINGDTWVNPLYPQWCAIKKGTKKDSSDNLEECNDPNSSANKEELKTDEQTEPSKKYSESELNEIVMHQPLHVIESRYRIRDEINKFTYPDMLQAIIQNDSDYDIKNAIIAFAAWDFNNLPVKIKGTQLFDEENYIKKVKYSDINLVPNEQYGNTSGYKVDIVHKVNTIKAIVVSFETFGGEKWDNPYFDAWCSLFEGQNLKP